MTHTTWNEHLAQELASEEQLELTPEHWQVIYCLREYYEQYELIPPLRILVKVLKEKYGDKLGNSVYLHQLFPDGVLKQACKIASLPKPKHCL